MKGLYRFQVFKIFKLTLLAGILLTIVGCVHMVNQQSFKQVLDCQNFSEPSVHCGQTPSTSFDNSGRLWVTYVLGSHVYVSYSDDLGNHYSNPVQVNDTAEEIYTNGENRPKIGFGHNGEIYISWTKVTGESFAGDIRFSRSYNNGASFEVVKTINDDGLVTSHRFETLFIDSNGNIYLAWLDKRDLVKTLARGDSYEGSALYYTVSTDNGLTFEKNKKVADYSCECCRIAMSETNNGNIAVFWRHIFGDNIRDHGFAILREEQIISPVKRVTYDNWKIDACPHHGPAMATGSNGDFHLTWFTLGELRKGIFYGQYHPETEKITNLVTVATVGSSHPHITKINQKLFLVWKQFDGKNTNVNLIVSNDEGETWGDSRTVALTKDASDHPLLLNHNGEVLLSWHTSAEGLRIIPLSDKER